MTVIETAAIEHLDFSTPEVAVEPSSNNTYVAHGRGVIAVAFGSDGPYNPQDRGSYVESGPIETHIPRNEDYTGKSSELLQYRRFNRNWLVAIEKRLQWQQEQDAVLEELPGLRLGEN